MGEKVALLLIAVILQIAYKECKARPTIENPFERYNINIGKRKSKTYKLPINEEASYIAKKLPTTSNMHQNFNLPDVDFPRLNSPERLQNTGLSISRKQVETDKLVEKFRKDARRKRKIKQHLNEESLSNQEKNMELFIRSETGTFPEVEYPLSAMDTWTPKYWNPLPFNAEDKYFNPDAFHQVNPNTKQIHQYTKPSSIKGNNGLLFAKKTEEIKRKDALIKTQTNTNNKKLVNLNKAKDNKDITMNINNNLQNVTQTNTTLKQEENATSKIPSSSENFYSGRRVMKKKVLSKPLKARSRLRSPKTEIKHSHNSTCSIIDQDLNTTMPMCIYDSNETAANIAGNVGQDVILEKSSSLSLKSSVNQFDDSFNSSHQSVFVPSTCTNDTICDSQPNKIKHEPLVESNKSDLYTKFNVIREESKDPSNNTSTTSEGEFVADTHPIVDDPKKSFTHKSPNTVNTLQEQLRSLSSAELLDLFENILTLVRPVSEDYATLKPPLYAHTNVTEQVLQTPLEPHKVNSLSNLSQEFILPENQQQQAVNGKNKQDHSYHTLLSGLTSNMTALHYLVDRVLAQFSLQTNDTLLNGQSMTNERYFVPTDYILCDTASMDILSALHRISQSENDFKDSVRNNTNDLSDTLICIDHGNQTNATHKQSDSIDKMDSSITSEKYLIDTSARISNYKKIDYDSQFELIYPNPASIDQFSAYDRLELKSPYNNTRLAHTVMDILTGRLGENNTGNMVNSEWLHNIINSTDAKKTCTSNFSRSLINMNTSKIISALKSIERLVDSSTNDTEVINDNLLNKMISVCDSLLNMDKSTDNESKYALSLSHMPSNCILLDYLETENMPDKPINDNISEKLIKLDDFADYLKPDQTNTDDIINLLFNNTLTSMTFDKSTQTVHDEFILSNASNYEILINDDTQSDVPSDYIISDYITESQSILDKPNKLAEKYTMSDNSPDDIKSDQSNSKNIQNLSDSRSEMPYGESLQNLKDKYTMSNQSNFDTLTNLGGNTVSHIPESIIANSDHNFSEIPLFEFLNNKIHPMLLETTKPYGVNKIDLSDNTSSTIQNLTDFNVFTELADVSYSTDLVKADLSGTEILTELAIIDKNDILHRTDTQYNYTHASNLADLLDTNLLQIKCSSNIKHGIVETDEKASGLVDPIIYIDSPDIDNAMVNRGSENLTEQPEVDKYDIPDGTISDDDRSYIYDQTYLLEKHNNNPETAETDENTPKSSASKAVSDLFDPIISTNSPNVHKPIVQPEKLIELPELDKKNVTIGIRPGGLTTASNEELRHFVYTDTLPKFPDIISSSLANTSNKSLTVSGVTVNDSNTSMYTDNEATIDGNTAENNLLKLYDNRSVSDIIIDNILSSDTLDIDLLPDAIIQDQTLFELLELANKKDNIPDVTYTDISETNIADKNISKIPNFNESDNINDLPDKISLNLHKTDIEPRATKPGVLFDLFNKDNASDNMLRENANAESVVNETSNEVLDQLLEDPGPLSSVET